MKKKTFTFIGFIVRGIAGIARIAILFIRPVHATAIVAIIDIVSNMTINLIKRFVKVEK